MSTPRNSAATSAANTSANPTLAIATSPRRGAASDLVGRRTGRRDRGRIPRCPGRAIGHHRQRSGDDRRLNEEDRPPRERLGQHAAQRRSDGGTDGGGQRPPSTTPPRTGHQRHQDRQRSGEQQRGADALRRSGAEQDLEAAGSAGDDRRRGKQRGTREHEMERMQSPVQRRHRDRGDRHCERVRREHPGDADDRRVELAVQLGEGERDDRGIGKGERHRGEQQGDDEPAPGVHRRRHARIGVRPRMSKCGTSRSAPTGEECPRTPATLARAKTPRLGWVGSGRLGLSRWRRGRWPESGRHSATRDARAGWSSRTRCGARRAPGAAARRCRRTGRVRSG